MPKFLKDYPITIENLEIFTTLVKLHENFTSLWLPGSGKTYFAGKLVAKKHLSKVFPQNILNNLIFITLDFGLSEDYIEKQFNEALSIHSNEQGIARKLNDLISRKKQIVIILDSFSFLKIEMIKYLLSLRNLVDYSKVTYLILALESDFYTTKVSYSDFATIFHNVIKIPYLNKNEASEYLDMEAKTLEVKVTKSQKEQIFRFAGGIINLLINSVRGIKLYKSFDKTLASDQMKNTITNLWDGFTPKERTILKSIVTTGKVPPNEFELNYFKEQKLITKNNKIIGDWVKYAVGKISRVQVELKGDFILWDGVNIGEVFSKSENLLLKTMLQSPSMLIKRDKIASILWRSPDKYSDWAIDQAFSRIRKKITSIGIDPNIIKTIKGVGFKLENVILINKI